VAYKLPYWRTIATDNVVAHGKIFNMKRALVVLGLAVILTVPVLVNAQTQLVPEACLGDPSKCGSCELVDLVNNLIGFVLWFATVGATLMVVYGGFRLVTAGGNVDAMTKAKSIVTNVIIGYVLALAAFMIINTLLSILLPSGSPVLGWQNIECLYATPTNTKDSESNDDKSYGDFNLFELISRPSKISLGSSSSGGGATVSSKQFFDNKGTCSESFLSPYFGGDASEAACIVRAESACGGSLLSRSDKDRNGYPFSIGIFQVNMTVHHVIGCAGIGAAVNDLNCPGAYSGRNYSAYIVNRNLYDQCKKALLNPQCAAKNAVRIRSARGGSWKDWSTASGCGLR